jgi:hypothetical protein
LKEPATEEGGELGFEEGDVKVMGYDDVNKAYFLLFKIRIHREKFIFIFTRVE